MLGVATGSEALILIIKITVVLPSRKQIYTYSIEQHYLIILTSMAQSKLQPNLRMSAQKILRQFVKSKMTNKICLKLKLAHKNQNSCQKNV